MKRALLIGCNYGGSEAELNGCHNDVESLLSLLIQHKGFERENIIVLVDKSNVSNDMTPTGKNIRTQLTALIESAQQGDILVFHFSGHGTQIPAEGSDHEVDGKDEAIVPCDLNLIVDDDLREILHNLPTGCEFTFIADCCHSGGMLDHAEIQIDGAKDGGGSDGAASIMQVLSSLTGRGIEAKNKSLPVSLLAQMLSSRTGKDVKPNNIRTTLSDMFGGDASKMVLSFADAMKAQYASAQRAPDSSKPSIPMMIAKALFACVREQQQKQQMGESEMPPAQAAVGAGRKPNSSQQLSEDKGVLITGCQSHETSADACPSGNRSEAYGALTNAICTQVNRNPEASFYKLVCDVREQLTTGGFSQNPCLECSSENSEKPFIC